MFVYHLFYQVTEERCELGLTRLGRVLKVGPKANTPKHKLKTCIKHVYSQVQQGMLGPLQRRNQTAIPQHGRAMLWDSVVHLHIKDADVHILDQGTKSTWGPSSSSSSSDRSHQPPTIQFCACMLCNPSPLRKKSVLTVIKTGLNYQSTEIIYFPFFKVVRLFPITTGTNDVTCNCDSFRVMCRCCGWPVLFRQLPSGLYYRRQRWCDWVQVLYLY